MRDTATPSSDISYEKHGLVSARSDDIRNDTSDNDDLEHKHRDTLSGESTNVKKVKQSGRHREKQEISADIIARYKQAIADDEVSRNLTSK